MPELLTEVPSGTAKRTYTLSGHTTLPLDIPFVEPEELELRLDGKALLHGAEWSLIRGGRYGTVVFDGPKTGTLEVIRHARDHLSVLFERGRYVDGAVLQHALARLHLLAQDARRDIDELMATVAGLAGDGSASSGSGPVLDMAAYGCDPTGTYDSAPVIEDALAEGHRHLWFPPGTYRLSREVRVAPGTRVIGAGPFATVFVAEGPYAFYAAPDPDLEGYQKDWNDATFRGFRIVMAGGGIRSLGHRLRCYELQFAGGHYDYWCIDARSGNELTIVDIEAGWSGGDLTLQANGIRLWSADTTYEDLQANDAAGEEPGSWFGGTLGERDINFGDCYVARCRIRFDADVPDKVGLYIGHLSTKKPSAGDTTPNSVAGVMNNIVVENCQFQARSGTPHIDSAFAYRFRRIQRCTFIGLNPEGCGRQYVLETDATSYMSAEANKHNVFVGCQSLTSPSGVLGIELVGLQAMPTVIGGQGMAPWGGPITRTVAIGEDSTDPGFNAGPRDTYLSGQIWLGSQNLQTPELVLRQPSMSKRSLVEGQLVGDGVATEIVLDLPRPTSGLRSDNIEVSLDPSYWPRLTEGSDYTWQLEKVSARWDRVRITLATPPDSGTTVYARVATIYGNDALQVTWAAQDDGTRTDEWSGYWSTHPKNPFPTHGIALRVGEQNAAYISRTVGALGRQDARLLIGNGPDLGSSSGVNGPLAYVGVLDPLRLEPWPHLPTRIVEGAVIEPDGREAFGQYWQYWLGRGWYRQTDVSSDGAASPAWDWTPLAWQYLVRVGPLSTSRELSKADLGRVLVHEAAADITLTIRNDLLREDEAGVNWTDTNGNHLRVAGWFQIANVQSGYNVQLAAAAGVTIVHPGAATPGLIGPGKLAHVLLKRTGAQQLTAYVLG